MKLGARILKTGIAITLALVLSVALNLPSPVFAGIAAVFAIQPTIYRSYLSIIEQVQGNAIGAALAIGFVMLFGTNPLFIGLACIIAITINLKLKIENTIPVVLVTIIAIMENPGEDFLEFALIRSFTIILGVFSASLVNLVFLPPKYEKRLYMKLVENTEEIIKWIRMKSWQASEHVILKETIESLKEKMIKLEQLYLLYKEERSYFKKQSFSKTRKLVLYRQMIMTTNTALQTLKRLHRIENELGNLPKDFLEITINELDYLLNFHEQIHMRFIGKLKSNPHEDILQEEKFNKDKMIEQLHLFHSNCPDQTTYYHMLQLIAEIIDYSEQLGHLETLITSFQSYHKSENEVPVELNQE